MMALQDAVAALLRETPGVVWRVVDIRRTVVPIAAHRYKRGMPIGGRPDEQNVRLCCERLVKAGTIEKLNGPACYPDDPERARFASGAEVGYRWIEPDRLNDTDACLAHADVTILEVAFRLPSFEPER